MKNGSIRINASIMETLEEFPPAIFWLIFGYLSAHRILGLRRVSQTMRNIVDTFVATYDINRKVSTVCVDGNCLLPPTHPRAAFSWRMNPSYPPVGMIDLLECHRLGMFFFLGLQNLSNDTIMTLMASGHNTTQSCSFYASRRNFVPNDALALAMCTFPRDVLIHMRSLLNAMHANGRLSRDYTRVLMRAFFRPEAMHNPNWFWSLLIGPPDRPWACQMLLEFFALWEYTEDNSFHMVELHNIINVFKNEELVPIVRHVLTRGMRIPKAIFFGIGFRRGIHQLASLVALSKIGISAGAADRADTAHQRALHELAHVR